MSEATEEQAQTDQKPHKRKKKRSSMQMAKKFARRRDHSAAGGNNLDSDTYQYMVRILEMMKQDFPTPEEKLIFVNNVYEQSIGHEVEYAKNQVGSRVLDSLMDMANLEIIERLVDAFKESLRPLCTDRFASHVLQKIIVTCAERGNRTKSEKLQKKFSIEVSKDEAKSYNDIALKLCKYFINNLEEFVWDTYANHVLRAVMETLGGLLDKLEEPNKKKTGPCLESRRPVTKEYSSLLKETCDRLYKAPQFLEFGRDELTSGFVQAVLYSLKDVDSTLSRKIVEKIINECFSDNGDNLSDIFDSEPSLRLLETCLATSDSKLYSEIYAKFFKGRLKELVLMEGVNFSVQRLLDNCPTKEILEEIFDELSPHFTQILAKGYNGVFASLGNACGRVHAKQGPFVNSISQMLSVSESAEKQDQLVTSIVTLKSQDQIENLKKEGGKVPLNLHGSLIIQSILNFNKPIKIVNSLLAIDNEELISLFGDPKGSRIADAFMDSQYIGEKSREKLWKKFKGYWVKLASTTHGSRTLDKMWEKARSNQRIAIMEELAEVGQALKSTKTGKLVFAKYNVALFVRSKKDWSEYQGKEDKTKNLFADIIGESGSVSK